VYKQRNIGQTDQSSSQKPSFLQCAPFFPDKAYCQYYIKGPDEKVRISTTSTVSDEFIHNLCQDCTYKTKTINGKIFKLWHNPNSGEYISIVFSPTQQYGFIGDMQIDYLGDNGDETEFSQSQADSWIDYAKDW